MAISTKAKEREREYGREYRKRPEVAAKRAARARSPETKARHREYLREYNQRPEVKERLRVKRAENREYQRKYNTAYHQLEENKAKGRARFRERLYGLTPSQFEQMLRDQDGKCAICGNTFVKAKEPHVDHDHESGRVRELLCCRCNPMLGHAKDSIATLRAAIAYLQRHGKGDE